MARSILFTVAAVALGLASPSLGQGTSGDCIEIHKISGVEVEDDQTQESVQVRATYTTAVLEIAKPMTSSVNIYGAISGRMRPCSWGEKGFVGRTVKKKGAYLISLCHHTADLAHQVFEASKTTLHAMNMQ